VSVDPNMTLDQYSKQLATQAQAPEAPLGVQQEATRAQSDPTLAGYLHDQGYVPSAQSWYTGANSEGTNNGWDTTFINDSMTQYNAAVDAGTAQTYFERPDANGVVLWDHDSSDGKTHYSFGDVYQDGKKEGNVYDQFDKNTANLMMSQLMFDAKQKAEVFSSSDVADRLDREVTAARDDNNANYENNLKLAAFQQDVTQREEGWGGWQEAGIVGGGAAGGAAVGAGAGAALGSVVPVAGTAAGALVGGIAGGVAGGVGAFLNRDSLTEQAARAYEITHLSNTEFGTAAAVATGLQQWGGFAGRSITPFQNVVEGTYDAMAGTTGDGRSEFFDTDPKTGQGPPAWMKVADIGASLADAGLMYASGVGVTLYTAQMGTTIAGEVGELGLTGGSTFDYNRADFDNIFTDDNGNFSFTRAAAGIGKVGIDVVQVAAVRGLASTVDSKLLGVGEEAAYTSGIRGLTEKYLVPFRSAEKQAALQAGGKETVEGGFRFTTDAEGNVVGRVRPSISLAAPSEAISALNARVLATRSAADVLPADAFYSAVKALSSGERTIVTALVNGFGESAEEGLQQVLDPYSHDDKVNASDVFSSMGYGFAMGAGMGAAMGWRSPTADQKLFAQAQAAHYVSTGGGTLTQSEWDSKTEMEKRSLASQGKLTQQMMRAALSKITDEQNADRTSNVIGYSKLVDAVQSMLVQNLKSATRRTDGSFVIIPLEDSEYRSDAVTSSGKQLALNYLERLKGLENQIESHRQQLDALASKLAADPNNEQLQARQTQLETELRTMQLMKVRGLQLLEMIDASVSSMYAEDATPATVAGDAASLNQLLADAYDRNLDHLGGVALSDEDKMALARVVTQISTRYPQDASRSWQAFLPQVNPYLTTAHADQVLGISQSVLGAIRGDFDGDKIANLEQLVLDDTAFTNLRAGAQFLGASPAVNVTTTKAEEWIVTYLSQSLQQSSTGLGNEATATMIRIGDAIQARYGDVVDQAVLDEVINSFNEVLKTGEGDARAALLNGLADKAGGQITAYARGHLSNEWLWISRMVQTQLQDFQRTYAANTPGGTDVNTEKVPVERQSSEVIDTRTDKAATPGITLAQQTAGDELFRKFQKLHYSSITSTDVTAMPPDQRATIEEMAQFYEALGANLTRQKLEELHGKDEITGRVYLQLERLATGMARLHPSMSPAQSMAVIANMRVLDLDVDANGEFFPTGRQVTLAQFLLKRSVLQDQQEKSVILDSSPELQARHAKYLVHAGVPTQGRKGSTQINAEKAFVDVFGSTQMYLLLGDDAVAFGKHVSVEQYVRYFQSQSIDDRNEIARALKENPNYGARTKTHDLPYDLDEVAGDEPQITAFQSVVDALLAVGRSRIAMGDDGHLTGEYADTSDSIGATFRHSHQLIREAMLRFANLSKGEETGLNTELVQRLLENYPDLANQVAELIPNNAANWVLRPTAGGISISKWLLDMFATNDSAEAEMIFYRNLLMSEWFASGAGPLSEEIDADNSGYKRQYNKLPRRMHQIMWRLNMMGDSGAALRAFITQLTSATSVEEFIRWVNTTPTVRGEQAPVTAWVDEVAEFDMDKAQGGWTSELRGTSRREAVESLQRSAENLVDEITQERLAQQEDTATIASIARHARAIAADPNAVSSQADRDRYRQLEEAIKEAGRRYTGLGPQAMVYQSLAAVYGFYAQAHNKGQNPEHLDAAAAIDALVASHDYVTNVEKVMAHLTSQNIDAVAGNLDVAANDGGRSMDEFGRTVAWTSPSVEQVLELLSNPDTKPMARAMLWPQVMERDFDGVIRRKTLFDKSLKSLLDGSTHKDLFGHNDTLSDDDAFRYLSVVEAKAREFDGHFSVQRAVNDIAIARLSAADHVLSFSEVERIVLQTYRDVAKIGQVLGAVNADLSGDEPLLDILDHAKRARRQVFATQRLGLEATPEDFQYIPLAVDEAIQRREADALEAKRRIRTERGRLSDVAEIERMEHQLDLIDAATTEYATQLRLLTDDDYVGQVTQMFTINPQDPAAGGVKDNLVKYVTSHMSLMERSSSSLLLLSKITSQLSDPIFDGQIVLTDKEWTQLSHAVIAVYIDDAMSVSGANISVPPYPNEDFADNRKYFDPSFGYLLDSLMDPNGALMMAFRAIHKRAGRHDVNSVESDVIDILNRTIYADGRLGEWTSDIPRASIEANQLLDSASAAPAIAMTGNANMRQAVISAAMRRRYDPPDPSLLSMVSLGWTDIGRGDYDEVMVTHPTGASTMPLVQLNNRFASAVSMVYTDADGVEQSVDLLAEDPNLGRYFTADDVALNSDYQEIHRSRLQDAVARAMARVNMSPEGVLVNVSFFHPDMQPSAGYHNNLFFEGTNFKYDADVYASLNAGLFFSEGGINAEVQGAALDSRKLGLRGLQPTTPPLAAQITAIEIGEDPQRPAWTTDLAQVLRDKTRLLMNTNLGNGALAPEFYNAIYKNFKIRHYVDGTLNGIPVRWTAEQVIEHQMQHPGEPLPLESPTLWVPSDDVLRTMLGEQGTEGVARITTTDLTVDLSTVPQYNGVTPEMTRLFDVNGETRTLDQTSAVPQSRQQLLQINLQVPDSVRSAFELRIQKLAQLKNDGYIDRAGIIAEGSGEGKFKPSRNIDRALQAGMQMLQAEAISMDWVAGGVPYINMRDATAREQSERALQQTAASLKMKEAATGYVYAHNGESLPPAGLLSQVSLSGTTRPGYSVLPGDLVVIDLASFNGDRQAAYKVIDYMMGRGAILAFGETNGSNDMRAEMADYALSKNYVKVSPGANNVFLPVETTARYQNQRARLSSLVEAEGVSKQSRIAVLLAADLNIGDNGAWVAPQDSRLTAISETLDLVPVDFLVDYNVPVALDQITDVRNQLQALDTVEGRALLREQANSFISDREQRRAADLEFDRVFSSMLARFTDSPGTVLPEPGEEFGTGDLIPLVNNQGQILLYRHGFKAPTRDQVDAMAAQALPGSSDPAMVATFPSEIDTRSSTHRGTVREFKPRSGYGLSVDLEIELQHYGDKKVLEWNGMKYLLTPMPEAIKLPSHPMFATNDWGINAIASAHDTASKESMLDIVNNHRNAFAFLGIDFLPDVAKFFDTTPAKARELLNAIAALPPSLTIEQAYEINASGVITQDMLLQLPTFAGLHQELANAGWVNRLTALDSVEAQITAAMITYLMTPGARVQAVLHSGGFNDPSISADSYSQKMPRLFTQVFDQAELGSELRTEINRRLNTQFNNPNNDGTGYVLNQDWSFEVRNADPRTNMTGFLQFAKAHSSGDNPVINGLAFHSGVKTGVSQYSMALAQQAVGGHLALLRAPDRAAKFLAGEGVRTFDKDLTDGGVWRMLTDIDPHDRSVGANWRADMPMEADYKNVARELVAEFRQTIDTDLEDLWTDSLRKQYRELKLDIVRMLGLRDSQTDLVDFWVRQHLGLPLHKDQSTGEKNVITGKGAVASAKDILDNVSDGYLPTIAAEIPMLHVVDLQLIRRANLAKKTWAPKVGLEPGDRRAETWDEWVKVSLGVAMTMDNTFDRMFLTALDGMMHSYYAATRALIDLPVSFDSLRSEQLFDPETNRMKLSISPVKDEAARDEIAFDRTRESLDEILGGYRIGGKFHSLIPLPAELAKRQQARRRWRAERGMAQMVKVSRRNFMANGEEFVDVTTNTNALIRAMINLRLGTALLNPALYVSMGPEQWVRGSLDKFANLLTGQSTAGGAGKLAAKVGLSIFSPEQIAHLSRLYSNLGKRNDFRAMLYHDMFAAHKPYEKGQGRAGRVLEGYARLGSRSQDPTWGMNGRTLARRYLEAVMQHFNATPTLNNVTTDKLIREMTLDPLWVQKNHPYAHQSAMNAIAQLRSLKQTPMNLAFKAFYEPMSNSSHAGWNAFGNLVFKIPMMFSTYAFNVLVTITGMQGYSDALAALMHGRKKGVIGRIQAAVRGDPYREEEDGVVDMSSVLEGVDLARSFIRGGITQTGLFALGMVAGGLGLSGEDDETRKRRKLAAFQGVPYMYDPRRIENDFRNADAIFLDWLPPQISSFFRVTDENDPGGARSMVQLNWMMRQFISPVIGIERFFDTGDFRQVTWGFQDAVGAFPLVNTMMWDDAVSTAHELAGLANDQQKLGDAPNLTHSFWLLTNAVGTYEKMLFENSFVNSLYVSADRYDRDPYALPLRDSDGQIQRDIEGNPRPNDVALEPYVDPTTGEIITGYQNRDTGSALFHALTENRASLATVAELFTGFQGDFYRRDMPVKLREFDKAPVTQDQAEALVRKLSQDAGGQPALSIEEITSLLKNKYASAQNWDAYNQIDTEAQQIYNQQKNNLEPLSVLDSDGYEVLTGEGANAVLRGLVKGSVKTDSASLQGVYIPFEMRQAIQKDWMTDLIQEGVDLGLDRSQAVTRMKRLWYGPTDDPTVQGIGDLLWSKDISYSKQIQYKQLNTTYVTGPDGMPWATGFTRTGVMPGLLGAITSSIGLAPVNRAYTSEQRATGTDSLLNTTDFVNAQNTGLRGLELVDKSAYIPTDAEIGKAIEDAITQASNGSYTPYTPNATKTGSGYYSGGGGGGYGGGSSPYFSRMYALPGGTAPYANSIPFINSSNPYIRRADIQRNRVWSERGRLKQWQ
jgi:hypothetical protein